ncbi:hypothetical protein [Pseudomonas sp. PAMC 25886]|uniref:hypothetical protein n=1 Tax=Pseudomonas sp. PAMC 25886 TaxID=1125977 RepID=UPI001146C46C|nr:hypothetical protein [Pseudomonas sp. PAMC 25886]
MEYYVDVAPVPSPSMFYTSQAPLRSNPPASNSIFGATQFLATAYPGTNSANRNIESFQKLAKTTSQLDSTLLVPKAVDCAPFRALGNEHQVSAKDIEVSKIAESRIRLLAIKYANDSVSAEMIARLEILNSRLIEKSPRVTAEQISHLESSIDSIKSVEQSRLNRAQRLGLSV